MLGKLFKYNMKSVSKLLLLLHGVLLFLTLAMSLYMPTLMSLGGENQKMTAGHFLIMLGFCLYFLSIFAILFGTYILLAIRFYRNMFTDEGYLTHTLPVKSGTLLFSHILSTTLWMAISFVVSALCVAILAVSGAGIDGIGSFFAEMAAFYQASPVTVIACLLLFGLIGALASAAMIHLCICVGSLFPSHKVIASVVAYLAIYIFVEILVILIMILSPGMVELMLDQTQYAYPPAALLKLFLHTGILSLIFSILAWIACHIIISRHLNME